MAILFVRLRICSIPRRSRWFCFCFAIKKFVHWMRRTRNGFRYDKTMSHSLIVECDADTVPWSAFRTLFDPGNAANPKWNAKTFSIRCDSLFLLFSPSAFVHAPHRVRTTGETFLHDSFYIRKVWRTVFSSVCLRKNNAKNKMICSSISFSRWELGRCGAYTGNGRFHSAKNRW